MKTKLFLFLLIFCPVVGHASDVYVSTFPFVNQVYLSCGQSNSVRWSASPGRQTFAEKMQSVKAGNITVVSCGVPGSFMVDWLPGTTNYQNCLTAVSSYTVSGLIFNQGESEAEGSDPVAVSSWPVRFQSMVSGFRSDLGNSALPVVWVRLSGSLDNHPFYWNPMITVQTNNSFSNGAIVSTDGLVPDSGFHYSDADYAEIGQRIKNAFQTLSL